MEQKTKGILLSAFGRVGYIYAAFNMCVSIKKHNQNIKVALAFDRNIFNYLDPKKIELFDDLIEIPQEQFTSNRGNKKGIDPAKYKTAIYDYLPYDETLILDVDGCAMQDLQPLIDLLSSQDGNIYTDIYGYGKLAVWASMEYMKEIFGVDITCSIQSSWMYVKKPFKEFFDSVKDNFSKIDKSKITLWGNTIPDELVYQGTFAQYGIIPKVDIRPIFFGNYYDKRTFTELEEQFYILSLYGNGVGRKETKQRYIDFYDRIMRNYCLELGYDHDYKSGYIMQDKHLNFR
jgi:hypothetical protein